MKKERLFCSTCPRRFTFVFVLTKHLWRVHCRYKRKRKITLIGWWWSFVDRHPAKTSKFSSIKSFVKKNNNMSLSHNRWCRYKTEDTRTKEIFYLDDELFICKLFHVEAKANILNRHMIFHSNQTCLLILWTFLKSLWDKSSSLSLLIWNAKSWTISYAIYTRYNSLTDNVYTKIRSKCSRTNDKHDEFLLILLILIFHQTDKYDVRSLFIELNNNLNKTFDEEKHLTAVSLLTSLGIFLMKISSLKKKRSMVVRSIQLF